MPETNNLKCGDTLWCFDSETNMLYGPDSQYPLPPKHSALLCYFARNQHRYVRLEEIHNEVWCDRVVSDAAVRKVIVDLKRYLKFENNDDIIENRRSLGYRLNIPLAVKTTEQESDSSDQKRFCIQLDSKEIDHNAARVFLQEQRKQLQEHIKTLDLLEKYLDEQQT
ncbi:MAG: helix-turn-helix domain-containing protein [Marinomonas sp.]